MRVARNVESREGGHGVRCDGRDHLRGRGGVLTVNGRVGYWREAASNLLQKKRWWRLGVAMYFNKYIFHD